MIAPRRSSPPLRSSEQRRGDPDPITPVTAVLTQLEAGVRSVPDLASRTGLAPDLVRAVTDRLIRAGKVKPLVISTACAPTGCRDCASSGCPLSSVA